MSSKYIYRLLAVISVLSFLLVGAVRPASAVPWKDKVDPWVLNTGTQEETEFLVFLSSQADLSGAEKLSTKVEKGRYVYRTLTAYAHVTQSPLIAELDRLGVQYRPYWIANMIWVRGGLSTIQLLAQRLDVAHLYANPSVPLDAPIKVVSSNSNPQGIEWNISWVNAPQVWNMGYTGQGVVIGGQDTGFIWDHPAIKKQYRGWNGISVDHNYNWYDATHNHSLVPVDPYGHGTHTMGTMVGDDGGSNQIGMAPGARWIGCRNMDADGNGTPETYSSCYQWFIAPTDVNGSNPNPDLAPDVINNSWGCPPSEGCTDPNVLLTVVQNLVAAGIVTTHSAGNSGSACSTVSDPAAIYAESFTVGATGDHSNTITGFSSRGPVTVDGSNRPKPDIAAPGENVRSSVPGNGYASYYGTSMASPHVAGLVALLISAYPEVRGNVTEIESAIERTALHIPSNLCNSAGVPNNVYGWGRIDALAMVDSYYQMKLDKIASAQVVQPGGYITYTLTVTHSYGINPTTNNVISDTLPAGTTFVFATSPAIQTGDVIRWSFPGLKVSGTYSVELVVKTDPTVIGVITNSVYGVYSDQTGLILGAPVSTRLGSALFLPITIKMP